MVQRARRQCITAIITGAIVHLSNGWYVTSSRWGTLVPRSRRLYSIVRLYPYGSLRSRYYTLIVYLILLLPIYSFLDTVATVTDVYVRLICTRSFVLKQFVASCTSGVVGADVLNPLLEYRSVGYPWDPNVESLISLSCGCLIDALIQALLCEAQGLSRYRDYVDWDPSNCLTS